VNLAISVIIGVLIFIFVLKSVGGKNIMDVLKSIIPLYLLLYFILGVCGFFLATLRWKVLVNVYDKDVGFFKLLKQVFACFSISYLTPIARIGGEPLKAFMLSKETKIDTKTAATTIIIDKAIEFTGSIMIGIIGLYLIFYIPEFPILPRIALSFLIALSILVLVGFYRSVIKKKRSFSYLFNLFKLYKIKKLRKFNKSLVYVEDKLNNFFIQHKKEFLFSCFFYLLFGIFLILETKFLLLGLGFNASLKMIILVMTVIGIANCIPVPAALGFLEAGQSSLFLFTQKNAGMGFSFSLIQRTRSMFFVALGLVIISHFGGNQIIKKK